MEGGRPLAQDTVGLLEGIASTRAIRRYRDEAVPAGALRDILFAATRAPSGSNRQPFRFVVLSDGPRATEAKALIGGHAREVWAAKRAAEAYDEGSGSLADSPKARMARTMQRYVDDFERCPVLVLACLERSGPMLPTDGGSVFPACQNLLLAARALGYGGVLSGWHQGVEAELRTLLDVPDEVHVLATITLGRPEGRHGPVRRRPMAELVFEDAWGRTPVWAVEPPGTAHTGRPRAADPVERRLAHGYVDPEGKD